MSTPRRAVLAGALAAVLLPVLSGCAEPAVGGTAAAPAVDVATVPRALAALPDPLRALPVQRVRLGTTGVSATLIDAAAGTRSEVAWTVVNGWGTPAVTPLAPGDQVGGVPADQVPLTGLAPALGLLRHEVVELVLTCDDALHWHLGAREVGASHPQAVALDGSAVVPRLNLLTPEGMAAAAAEVEHEYGTSAFAVAGQDGALLVDLVLPDLPQPVRVVRSDGAAPSATRLAVAAPAGRLMAGALDYRRAMEGSEIALKEAQVGGRIAFWQYRAAAEGTVLVYGVGSPPTTLVVLRPGKPAEAEENPACPEGSTSCPL